MQYTILVRLILLYKRSNKQFYCSKHNLRVSKPRIFVATSVNCYSKRTRKANYTLQYKVNRVYWTVKKKGIYYELLALTLNYEDWPCWKISFFANYTKLTRKLNQAYMQFNMQSHHRSYCTLIKRLKSSLSIKIDLV